MVAGQGNTDKYETEDRAWEHTHTVQGKRHQRKLRGKKSQTHQQESNYSVEYQFDVI